jgi:hypothetical protein
LRQQLRLSQAMGGTSSAPTVSQSQQPGVTNDQQHQYRGGLQGSTGAVEQGDRPFPSWMALRPEARPQFDGMTQEECESEAGQTAATAVTLPPECALPYWHRPGFSVCEVGPGLCTGACLQHSLEAVQWSAGLEGYQVRTVRGNMLLHMLIQGMMLDEASMHCPALSTARAQL